MLHYLTDPLQFTFMQRALVAVVLSGCAQTTGYDNQPAPRRCDRNGDIDERKAC